MPEEQKLIEVTIGLPLPSLLEYITDVSWQTREAIGAMAKYCEQRGIQLYEKVARGINVASNHNKCANEMRGEWLLICGSDHTFAPEALSILLEAAAKPPYPKIIGGVIPYRSKPYQYVACRFSDDKKDQPYPLVPYIDFHPGETFAGGIREVDVIGSGFCLYNRSVFDTVPYPWFLYAQPGPFLPETEDLLLKYNGMTFAEFLESLASGDRFLSDEDKVVLRQKADKIRRYLARARFQVAYGPDYYFCRKAAAYGFKTYVHFGCTVMHFDFVPITPWDYITQINADDRLWWNHAMKAQCMTVENVQKVRAQVEGADRLRRMEPEALMKEWDDAQREGAEAPAAGEQGSP